MENKFIFYLARKIAPLIIKWRGNLYHYKKAIKQAERLTKGASPLGKRGGSPGKRTYIYFIGGKYRALNRKQIQYWRNKTKGVRVGLSVSNMKGIQLYDTMGHINSHPTYTKVEVRGINIQYKRALDLKANRKS